MTQSHGYLLTPNGQGGYDVRRLDETTAPEAPLPAGARVMAPASSASAEGIRRIIKTQAAGLRKLADCWGPPGHPS